MIRSFFVDFVFPVLLFLLVRSLLSGFMRRPVRRDAPRPSAEPRVSPGGELVKDPVCGTYVSAAASVTRTVNGKVLHFCSKDCSQKFGTEVRR
jgi:YHS domain-containing protein